MLVVWVSCVYFAVYFAFQLQAVLGKAQMTSRCTPYANTSNLGTVPKNHLNKSIPSAISGDLMRS